MKYFVYLAAVSLIAACGTTGTTRYTGTKPGAGQAEFANDFLECKVFAGGHARPDDQENTIKLCMQGKGWLDIKTTYTKG